MTSETATGSWLSGGRAIPSDPAQAARAVLELHESGRVPVRCACATDLGYPCLGQFAVGSYCTLAEGRKRCADMQLGGKDDWRHPSLIDLASLLNHGRVDDRVAIDVR